MPTADLAIIVSQPGVIVIRRDLAGVLPKPLTAERETDAPEADDGPAR